MEMKKLAPKADDLVMFISGARAKTVWGLFMLLKVYFVVSRNLKKALPKPVCFPCLVSSREILSVSYWPNREALYQFIDAKWHHDYVKYIDRISRHVEIFNEVYSAPQSIAFVGERRGAAFYVDR